MHRKAELGEFATIRVVGVGGGGGNAINRLIEEDVRGVEFIAANTDAQALLLSDAPIRIRLGQNLTQGLGAGGDPAVGEAAAEESLQELHNSLKGSDMVFITAGMGGGTGTGAAPVVARVAREFGALTIGVVTRPFMFEGTQRAQAAEQGIARLKEHVHTLIVIPNDRILELAEKRLALGDAFKLADACLLQGIQGISELITVPGLINLDFADVKAIMSEGGAALLAVGQASGSDRARLAAEQALNSRLVDVSISGASGILLNITGGADLSLFEVEQAASFIRSTAHPEANIILGAVIDPSMDDQMRITVIATGFGQPAPSRRFLFRHPSSAVSEQQNREVEAEPVRIRPSSLLHESLVRQATTNLDIPAFLRKRQA